MSTAVATGDELETETPASPGPGATQRQRFFWVTLAVTFGVSAAFLVRILIYTHGHLVYVIDDPGIHLAMARNLAQNGTWGVTPGVYEPASSSPLWTLMLAGVIKVASPLASVAPLVVNLAAAVWVLWIFATQQTFTKLARGHWGSWAFVILLPLCGLFLPGLAYTGMEHTLHAAIALQVFVLLTVLIGGDASRRQQVAYFALLALGSFVRLETMFLAAGCGAALLFATSARIGGADIASRWPVKRRVVNVVGTAVAAGIPVLIIGGINKAFDRHFFPNSVVAKTALGKDKGLLPGWQTLLDQLNQDVLLGVLVTIAIVYLIFVFSGFRGRSAGLAMAFAVTTVLHAAFASIGWYERYQAYLVIAGLFLMLRLGTEIVLPRWREAALMALAVVLVLFSAQRTHLLVTTPLASSNTYRQQYQVGRFMHRYYDGKPIAVQDLGYVAYLHHGPIVDVNGLGSHEVLDLMKAHKFGKQAMRDLIDRNHVQAIVLFADAYGFGLPRKWIGVGEWKLGQKKVSPLYSTVTFYAPTPALAKQLERNLSAFRPELPAGVKTLDQKQMLERAFKNLGSAPETPSDIVP